MRSWVYEVHENHTRKGLAAVRYRQKAAFHQSSEFQLTAARVYSTDPSIVGAPWHHNRSLEIGVVSAVVRLSSCVQPAGWHTITQSTRLPSKRHNRIIRMYHVETHVQNMSMRRLSRSALLSHSDRPVKEYEWKLFGTGWKTLTRRDPKSV